MRAGMLNLPGAAPCLKVTAQNCAGSHSKAALPMPLQITDGPLSQAHPVSRTVLVSPFGSTLPIGLPAFQHLSVVQHRDSVYQPRGVPTRVGVAKPDQSSPCA